MVKVELVYDCDRTQRMDLPPSEVKCLLGLVQQIPIVDFPNHDTYVPTDHIWKYRSHRWYCECENNHSSQLSLIIDFE